MSSTPGFAATPNLGAAIASATLDTSLTAPSNVATVLSAASSGTRIDRIVFQGLGTTAAGVINVFAYDGSTYHLIDQVLVSAVTSSTTAIAWRQEKVYPDLVLKTGWSLRFAVTVSGLQSLIKATAFGGDY